MTKGCTTQFIRRFSGSTLSNRRHLISISDLTNEEFHSLVNRAAFYKSQIKRNAQVPLPQPLLGKTLALLFTKRSTRTRISSEAATNYFGGHPLFLGSGDIQLGVNESFYDSVKVISSMTAGIFARVNSHNDIQELVKHSSVPIINSLCDRFHPLQAICDLLTIKESFNVKNDSDLKGKKLTWIGDANNVINDLSVAALKYGMDVSVAIPKSYKFDEEVSRTAQKLAAAEGAKFEVINDPVTALENASVIVTDTFVSMGEELQTKEKLEKFSGFQVNSDLISKSNVNPDWKFMHCLPRHHQEVSDEVFYSDKSIVFPEAENRLYAAIAAIEAFIVNDGEFL